MSNDEHPDSLAAQAAAWVPPWERPRSEPDRDYQAAHRVDGGELQPVDASLPGGGDAGEVFDAAADDDVGDDDEVDLPFVEVIPTGDDEGADDAALAADDAGFRRGNDFGASAGSELGGGELDGAVLEGGAEDGRESVGDRDSDYDRVGDRGGEHGRPGADDDRDDRVGDQVGGVGDESAAYAAGAADALDALRGAAGQLAADGGDPGGAQLTTSPAAGPVGDAERAEAGSAVPVQGRRRRGDAGAPGEPAPRTSAGGEAASRGAAAAVRVTKPASEGAERGAADTLSDGVAAPEEEAVGAVPGLADDAELAAALEAIMLVVDEPVGELQLAQILEQSAERIARTLDDLSARYTGAGHGFDLRRAAGGWRLYTRPEYAAYVERFVLDGQSVRLTQAALETLAVVAYKQPVTRSRISAIRGVNCDGVMRTLVTRGLIEECGTEGETGAHLYRTTALFLEKLGLNSVDQLPPLAPFLPDDVEEVLDATG